MNPNRAALGLASKCLRPYLGRIERTVWDYDWDVCVVLDACRWDLWTEVAPPLGWPRGEMHWSVASSSSEWHTRTFDPSVVPDGELAVVTTNPFAGRPPSEHGSLEHTPLHGNPAVDRTDYVYEDSWGCVEGGSYLDTVHPGEATDRAWRVWDSADPDRMLVHYMQPHQPMRQMPDPEGAERTSDYQLDAPHIWDRLRDGEVSREDAWAAYADNLEWALAHVERLVRAVDGTVLLTSDHGNSLGEYGVWAHPPGVHTPELCRVMWAVAEGRGADELEDAEYESHDGAGETAEERLAALGYA